MAGVGIPFKQDVYGNPIYARLNWSKGDTYRPKPLALIYHAGGLVAGSAEIVPRPQIDYLCEAGFLVVVPNYRLVPQVTAQEAFVDCEDAFEWAVNSLPGIASSELGIAVNSKEVVALGHSSGGTMVLHLASIGKPLKAVVSVYPSIFVADETSNPHQPARGPMFEQASGYVPSVNDWAIIAPEGKRLSEAPFLSKPDAPRNRWLLQIQSAGTWMITLQPDGNFAAIDPMTRLSSGWPPIFLIHGSEDAASGRSPQLLQRAEREMRQAGVKEVRLEILDGVGHMFDHHPSIGTTDVGPKWQAIKEGLDWMAKHVGR